jgi:hypothetical protein
MITKEKHPVCVLFFRDHEITGLRLAAAPYKDAIVTARVDTGRRLQDRGDDAGTLAVQSL